MDNIHARYAGKGVDIVVVVHNRVRLLIGKITSMPQCSRSTPDSLYITLGILYRIHLARERRIGCTDHIKQNPEAVFYVISVLGIFGSP